MSHAESKARHQSRPNRRFLRRLPAAVAAAALIAAAPGYAAVNNPPTKPAVVAPAKKQSAVALSETSAGGTAQTIGSKR
jgi:anti-sigma-K factor RskA